MGNSEEEKPAKPKTSSSAVTDLNKIHVYPDWAAMQAYYGPRFAVPPFMNSAVASPQAPPPPYMWAPPQSMIPPYGTPYAAFYAHGGVLAHPGVPLASTTLSMETAAKSPGNTDEGFVKKLKKFDGLEMLANGNGDSADRGTERRILDSDETGGSSDGSNGVTPQAGHMGKKRSTQGSPDKGDGKANAANGPMENTNNALEPKNVKGPINVPSQWMPNESWLHNERELKRERRKQSNRESARRSRLRKQAETEELAVKVQALTAENITLKSKINKLMENSEQLKLENAALMEKLKDRKVGPTEDIDLVKIKGKRLRPVGTVNLLVRVNNSDSVDGGNPDENQSRRAELH